MKSIRHRLTCDMLAFSFLLLGGGLAALWLGARKELIEQFDTALRAEALAISALVSAEGKGPLAADLTRWTSRGFRGENAQNFFELWRTDGTLLVRSESLHGADLPLRAKAGTDPKFWNLRLPDGRPGRALALAFALKADEAQPNSTRPVTLWLVVADDRGDLDEVLTELLGIGSACGLLLLAATLWVVPRVLRRGLAPLDVLGGQAAQIDAGSLAVRLPSAGLPAELQPICARLNALLARLEVSFARERQFSADLAHELRTPLAELQALAECALKWPDTRDSATDHEVLAVARQMETLVTHMLALARGEHGQLAVRREPVALDALVREVGRTFASRAEARGLHMSFALVPATVAADATLLRSILTNLFDNAVDHSPSGSEVRLVLEAAVPPAAPGVVLCVTNPAGHLDPADMEKLFDRFWRKESARSGGGQHTGLGLPLARMFANAMGWTLTAALGPDRGLTFTLVAPALGEAGPGERPRVH